LIVGYCNKPARYALSGFGVSSDIVCMPINGSKGIPIVSYTSIDASPSQPLVYQAITSRPFGLIAKPTSFN
ncbi:hypothetical protein, partial [Vallitalea maricola]|uniref:hypothetical protein n=1 Tax=Vallitalea maricola TaxID=3074433 RepID=UPI0030DC48F4